VRLPEAQQPSKAEMTKTIATARKLLEDAVARLRKPVDAGGEVSLSAAVGSLALAQVCLQMGEGAKAVEWIDDPKIGAHTLAKAGSKIIDRGNFRAEAFKAALRAYVATQQLDKAERTMNALEKTGNPADVARLYMNLGRQLEDSFKRLRAEGNEKEAGKAARGFEFFLTRIAARPAAESTFATLYWVADTFMTLGNSLAQGDGKPPADAMRFFKKAAEVYEKIIAACKADPKFASQPGAITACQIQLARCLRRQGEFKQSQQALVEVLKTRETLLEAQREAAYTYQAWGEDEPGYYILAIRGGHKVERKNGGVDYLIWGWGGIARRVQFIDKYNDTFNEARFNLAMCRLKYAESKKGQDRIDQLRQAESDILVVLRLQPKMGGEKWYGQYDTLLRDIQRRLGVKEDKQGLKAAEKEMSPGSK
jgi:tetratricopeptide (TPR) repeat protein